MYRRHDVVVVTVAVIVVSPPRHCCGDGRRGCGRGSSARPRRFLLLLAWLGKCKSQEGANVKSKYLEYLEYLEYYYIYRG